MEGTNITYNGRQVETGGPGPQTTSTSLASAATYHFTNSSRINFYEGPVSDSARLDNLYARPSSSTPGKGNPAYQTSRSGGLTYALTQPGIIDKLLPERSAPRRLDKFR